MSYHCRLNYAELIQSQVISNVAMQNKTFKLADVKTSYKNQQNCRKVGKLHSQFHEVRKVMILGHA
jgi:hypothetical protein